MRRLPVLNAAADEDERPAWQWVIIGVLFVYAIWAPLVMLGSVVADSVVRRVVGHVSPSDFDRVVSEATPAARLALWLALTAIPIGTYGFACWASGALIARFGARITAQRAAAAGAIAALVGAALSLFRANAALSLAALAVLLPLGALSAWLGSRLGIRMRTPAFHR